MNPLLGAVCSVYVQYSYLLRYFQEFRSSQTDSMPAERFTKVQGIIMPLSPGSSHPFHLNCLALNMNQTLGSAHPVTEPNISEDLNPQVFRCEKLEFCFGRRYVFVCVLADIAFLMIGFACFSGTLSSRGW